MTFAESDILLLKNLLDVDKDKSSSSDDDLPNTSAAKLGKINFKKKFSL